MNPVEWIAAAFVLTNVALVALRSVWNYPFALVAVTLYAFVFFEAKLYSDMLLQGFFFALNLYGWAAWTRARDESGVPVRWIYAVIGLVPVALAVTGLIVWWLRRKGRLALAERRAEARAA